MIELCNSPAKVVKIPIPTKCFWENFEVSINIFFQVIETKSLMALYMIMGISIHLYFFQFDVTRSKGSK